MSSKKKRVRKHKKSQNLQIKIIKITSKNFHHSKMKDLLRHETKVLIESPFKGPDFSPPGP